MCLRGQCISIFGSSGGIAVRAWPDGSDSDTWTSRRQVEEPRRDFLHLSRTDGAFIGAAERRGDVAAQPQPFAEGARGHLTKELKRIFELDKDAQPQTYGIGLKELWDIDPDKHEPGRVIHRRHHPS